MDPGLKASDYDALIQLRRRKGALRAALATIFDGCISPIAASTVEEASFVLEPVVERASTCQTTRRRIVKPRTNLGPRSLDHVVEDVLGARTDERGIPFVGR